MSKRGLEKDGPLITKIKGNVHCLRAILRLQEPDITLGKCFNIYAHFAGYKDWHVMSAVLKKMTSGIPQATDIVQITILAFDKDKDRTFKWLNSDNITLNGKKPIEIWGNTEGAQQVIDLLLKLNWELNSSAHLLS